MAITLSTPVTPAAEAAAQAYAERTGNCIQEALFAAGSFAYCHCAGCMEQAEAEAKAEQWAEGAWLRAAENAGEPCRGIWTMDGGCACC